MPKRLEVDLEELQSILEEVRDLLAKSKYKILENSVKLIVWLQNAVKEKSITIAGLRRMFFSPNNENFKNVKKRIGSSGNEKDQSDDTAKKSGEVKTPAENTEITPSSEAKETPAKPEHKAQETKPKKKGHGKRSLDDFDLSKITCIMHENLAVGAVCPTCGKGKVYDWEPETLLVFRGQPLIRAEGYSAQGLRCNKCGEIFRTAFPKEVATQPRADYQTKAMVCLAKYQLGTPLYRLETWQHLMKVPISDSEMWEWTESVALALDPIHKALTKIAARGEIIHNDDTSAKILALMAENEIAEKERALNNAKGVKNKDFRKGIYTTALLSKIGDYQIAFYCTGRKNAGENLDDLLDHRPKGLSRPVHACDASSSSVPERHETDVAKCFNHARHNFCELLEVWPTETLTIIEMINVLFVNDRKTKGMTPEDRLKYHQKHSTDVFGKIYEYCNNLIEKKIVEPNSGFGKAIKYLNNHKEGLGLFLKNGLAPISNNDAERIVKQKALIRKNSYFYKTVWGAFVGDILLSTIKTCGLNKANPYDYLIAIQANVDKVEKNPEAWLPWNYTKNTSCSFVKVSSNTVMEIYQAKSSSMPQPPQVDQEGQKKTFRQKAKDFFKAVSSYVNPKA